MVDHRIQNRQQLPHAGDQGDFFSFAHCEEPLIERPDHRIALGGHERGHVQRGAHRGAPAPTVAHVAALAEGDS